MFKVIDIFQMWESTSKIYLKAGFVLNRYLKQIFISFVAIIFIVFGIIILSQKYIVHKEECAEIALFPCQVYFENQKWRTALYGDNTQIGFLGVIKKFKRTKSAELAKAYAGICQYQLGNYKEAIIILRKFHGKDQLFSAQIIGAIADCEINLGNVKKGIEYFQKASIKANNSFLSPIFLKKIAIAYESLKNYKSALEIYIAIENRYPNALEATIARKNIERIRSKLLIN